MEKISFFNKKSFIIFSFVVLLFIIGGVAYFQIQKMKIPTPNYPVLKKAPKDFVLTLPVEKQYFENAVIAQDNPQNIIFFLNGGEPIKAVFNGKVNKILRDNYPFPNEPPFQEIVLLDQEENYSANYVFVGEVLVAEGQEIKKGDILSKAGEKGISWLGGGGNLSLWIHDLKAGKMLKITPELFQ